jgi:hypothetical protein
VHINGSGIVTRSKTRSDPIAASQWRANRGGVAVYTLWMCRPQPPEGNRRRVGLESDSMTSQTTLRNSEQPRQVRSSTCIDLFGNHVYLFFYLPPSCILFSG